LLARFFILDLLYKKEEKEMKVVQDQDEARYVDFDGLAYVKYPREKGFEVVIPNTLQGSFPQFEATNWVAQIKGGRLITAKGLKLVLAAKGNLKTPICALFASELGIKHGRMLTQLATLASIASIVPMADIPKPFIETLIVDSTRGARGKRAIYRGPDLHCAAI
jgi:hypothetical protein